MRKKTKIIINSTISGITCLSLSTLPIFTSCSKTNNNSSNDLNNKLNQLIKEQSINLKNNLINLESYNNINENNILNLIIIPEEILMNNYTVVEFQKNNINENEKIISFKLKKDNFISNLIEIKVNIKNTINPNPPIPPTEPEKPNPPVKPEPQIDYKFKITQSNQQNLINATDASLNFKLCSEVDVLVPFSIKLKLQNYDNLYVGKIQEIDKKNFDVSFNVQNLIENKQYVIESIVISIEEKNLSLDISNIKKDFTTLKAQDSIVSVDILNQEIKLSNPTNVINIRLDQLSTKNVNKKIKVCFTNNDKDYWTNILTTQENKLDYSFQISNLKSIGLYIFKGVYLVENNKETLLNNLVNDKQYKFNLVDDLIVEKPTNNSNKPLSEYGNFYNLQNANYYVKNDLNIQEYLPDKLSKMSLINKNEYYKSYFNILDNPINLEQCNDNITSIQDLKKDISINSIRVENNKVIVNIKNKNNVNISNIKFLVKSYDDVANYSKWVSGIKLTNNNEYYFNTSDVTKFQNKFVITNILINDSQVNDLDFVNKNLFQTNSNLSNLTINNFDVYKDNENKDIYGSLTLNWNEEQLKLISDKLVSLTFKITQKVFEPKYDPIGQITNIQDYFNPEYAVPEFKRIYIPFNQLSKFSLNGFQENIEYTLKSFQIINKDSYLPFSNEINVESKNLKFAFNLDWSSQLFLKNQLDENTQTEKVLKTNLDKLCQSSNANVEIPFSIENFNNALDYNFDVYNHNTRYENDTKKLKTPKINLVDNGIKNKINFFQPKELLANTIFNINQDSSQASVIKNLNSIVNLNNIDKSKVIIWLTFELDLNNKRLSDWTEFNDIHSRIRVPISLANLKSNQTISDVDFMFDNISESKEIQQQMYLKIKSNIKFDISLNSSNQLKLTLSARNNNIEFNNYLWLHNSSLSRSAFVSSAYMQINWLQDINEQTPLLSYLEQNKLDNLTTNSTSVGYNNTYNLEYETKDSFITIDGKTYPAPKNQLLPLVKKEDNGKRLFKEDKTSGIDQARNRLFCLDQKSDGSWNILAKVNDNPNDYRFYAMVNYHVWKTNRDSIINHPDYNAGDSVLNDENGNEYIEIKSAHLLAPTLTSNQGNNKQPIYFEDYEDKSIPVTGNKFDFNIPDNKEGIKYSIFMQFIDNKKFGFDSFKDNNGFDVSNTDIQNHIDDLDMIVAIVDFKPIFEEFENVNLDTYQYQNRNLTEMEKNAIKHFLNFKNIKPIEMSNETYHMNSNTNFNFYFSSFPKTRIAVNLESANSTRYREYLIGDNSIKLDRASANKNNNELIKTARGVFQLQNRYFDISNGSSGSAVYDYEGKLIGLEAQGSPATISSYIYLDTPKYSFYGNSQTKYNPYTFYNKVKRLSFLYPYKFKDIFKK